MPYIRVLLLYYHSIYSKRGKKKSIRFYFNELFHSLTKTNTFVFYSHISVEE